MLSEQSQQNLNVATKAIIEPVDCEWIVALEKDGNRGYLHDTDDIKRFRTTAEALQFVGVNRNGSGPIDVTIKDAIKTQAPMQTGRRR